MFLLRFTYCLDVFLNFVRRYYWLISFLLIYFCVLILVTFISYRSLKVELYNLDKIKENHFCTIEELELLIKKKIHLLVPQ
jgi:hypothetical protein